MKKVSLLFLGIFLISFIYIFFFSFLNLDEVWNYGFSYNISCGLIPYKDFNMLQTPLLFYIGSIFIKIFGNYLWSVGILSALIISCMMLIIYSKIGVKSLILYPIILVYSVFSYNIFCLLLGIILLNIIDKDFKYNNYIIAILISLIFLSKQNIGICMFVPFMFYSKAKIKDFIVFLIPILVFMIYLAFNNAFYDFINYAFLGILDFGESNSMYYFIVFYLGLIIYLGYKLFRSRFKNKHIFYILAFQVVGYPIVDDYHFMIGFILFLYYFLKNKKIDNYKIKYYIIISLSFLGIYISNEYSKLDDYHLTNWNSNRESFLYKRNMGEETEKLIFRLSEYVNKEKNNYDHIFIFNNWAYLLKLNMGDNPGIYDYILNGNMGYNGADRIVTSVDNLCNKSSGKKCLFIIQKGGNQININIIKYVIEDYKLIDKIADLKHRRKDIEVDSDYYIYINN